MQTLLSTLIAQAAADAGESVTLTLFQQLVAAFIFSLFGVVTLALCVWMMARLSPFSLAKEIEENHNTAAAIVMGAVLIGMSIIIAAALLG